MANENTMMTPPELARRWGVAADKVLHLIHTGQLRAINLAHDPDRRPRYRIFATEVQRFEDVRSTKPLLANPRRRRSRGPVSTKEYF
jgi:hypothetical protein